MITWNTELMATKTAVASRSPQDKSLQIRTIAIQRAKPTIISPVRNSGSSGKKVQAKRNMNAGPTTQFNTTDTTINWPFEVISTAWPKRTSASGRYIITNSPNAIGTEISPISIALRNGSTAGTNLPMSNPATIARRIHAASQRSKKDIRARRGEVIMLHLSEVSTMINMNSTSHIAYRQYNLRGTNTSQTLPMTVHYACCSLST